MFDLSTTWIKLNYFVLTNRQDLKKWWFLVLLAVAIFSTVFVITNVIVYVVNLPRQDALMASMAEGQVDYTAIRTASHPQSLIIEQASVLPVGTGRYDLVAKVKNVNTQWAATSVTYVFSLAGVASGEQTESIMAGQEQYLAAYNVSGPESAAGLTASVAVTHVTWQRIADPSLIPKADFTYSQLTQTSSTTLTGLHTFRVTAQVTNNAFIGFWKSKFMVILFNGTTVVGVNSVFLDKFLSGESRSLYAQWDNIIANVSSVSIVPSINLLDAANFIR